MYSSIGKVDEDVEPDHVLTGIGVIEVAVRRVLVPRRQRCVVACAKGCADGGQRCEMKIAGRVTAAE